MNDASTGIFFAVFGGLVACVGVPVLFVFVFLKLRNAQQEVDQTAAAVRSGTVAELLPWGPSSLGELTREWVGASRYTSGVLGRGDRASGRVPSGRAPAGWLLAFTMEARHDGTEGTVQATTSTRRLELRVSTGVCQAIVDGAPLGTFRLGQTELFATDATRVGTYRREPPVARLEVRGREVATLDTRTTSAAERAAAPTPLVTHFVTTPSAEEEAWVLVASVLELAWFGPRLAHQRLLRH